MRRQIWIATFACLLIAAGALVLWRVHERLSLQKKPAHRTVVTSVHSSSTAPNLVGLSTTATNTAQIIAASVKTNLFAYRLSNTTKSLGQLTGDRNAILLENALIDSSLPLNFSIPKNLQSQGEPGAYIVQARGAINSAFRAMLARAGAQIISYIPNNAYLVEISANGANEIQSSGMPQAVIPYEPPYKIQSSLLGLAMEDKPLPPQTLLNLGLFDDNAPQTISEIEKMGGTILARDKSPFGPVVTVQPPQNWTALTTLPGVQIVEIFRQRVHANDLSRATTGVAANTRVTTNYLGLTGQNVMVEVNDSGIDKNHPDLTGRVIGDLFDTNFTGRVGWDLVDTNGHGTHVAGIIAGDGTESTTVTSAEGSIMPGVAGQFRGMASKATLFSLAALGNNGGKIISDQILQEIPALTNALISNNSWNFDGDNAYDLAAASYDAATRDALPQVTGSQPVLFVFSAGNSGSGNNSGGGGFSDTILSPATAKNVITVGAIEQLRNITNIVTDVNSNKSAVWQPQTDSSFQVAGFSSRGNVGIGTEGTSGRFKPDVVAPGTFVISTRSSQWATNVYYNPTNDHITAISDLLESNSITDPPLDFFVFKNAVDVIIAASSSSSTNLPIYLWQNTASPTLAGNNFVVIPNGTLLLSPTNSIWQCAVSNTTASELPYNLTVDVQTTNDLGNYYQVLEGMNDGLGGFYRYESGTSMSAADVSGVLALMQDYFTNKLQLTPSPALLKALLINGARSTGNYNLNVQNAINYEGWGLISLPNSLPTGVTNQLSAAAASFFVDQSPTNALATGDSHKLTLNVATNASTLRLRVTLAWTDPPGNPSAAIKLVNNLDLVVSNMDTHTTYFGNDIPAGSIYNNAWDTNATSATNFVSPADSINNVEQVILPPLLSGHYAVTVIGKDVNVNAVSAQTNTYANNGPPGTYAPNIVQDYALVISCGEGEVPNAITLTDNGIVSNPTGDQNITVVTSTNTPLFNQFVGANTPLINAADTIPFTTTTYGNAQDTAGMTNQWHFYVVTNTGSTSDFTNAAFITFLPPTLSVPRMGVFADSTANSTRPEADIDLYVTTDSNLLVLSPNTISNCINSAQVGASVGGVFYGASLGRGGTEFVVDTNSNPTTPEVYYVGVKSEDQMASEYAFIPIFTQTPFSQNNTNGDQVVNGVPAPVNIPDGSPAHPQVGYMFAIALQPMDIERVIVTNTIEHQNFGDLVGVLTFSDGTSVVLNNHDEPSDPPPPGPYTFVYDDSGTVSNVPSGYSLQKSDGPGSLTDYSGQPAYGLWILSEVDNSQTQTGSIQSFSMLIQKHQPLTGGSTNTVPANSWFYDFIDVPAGVTNLTISATNLTSTASPPVELFVRLGAQPTTNNFDKMALLNNGSPPGNSISVGPSDVPPIQPGRYWIGIFNPDTVNQQTVSLFATLSYQSSTATINFASTNSTTILDDAVSYSSIFVATNLPVASLNVGIAVQHPRISDLVLHLISPDGTRVLLMENRGGTDVNGAGASITNSTATNYFYLTFTEDTNLTTTPIKYAVPPFVPSTITTNILTNNFEGQSAADYTNGQTIGGTSWKVVTNQVSLVTDAANAYDGSNFLALASGVISNTFSTVAGKTYTLTFAYRGPGIVGMWRGESNANDSIGTNSGILSPGVAFVPAKVGLGFQLNSSNAFVTIPAGAPLNVGTNSGFTLETWIYPTNVTALHPILEWNQGFVGGNIGPHLWLDAAGSGTLFANIIDTTNNSHQIFSALNTVVTNQFQHVALTYQRVSGKAVLYVNGLAVKSSIIGSFVPQTIYNLYIGKRPSDKPSDGSYGVFFGGTVDEPSVYNRALSASEIKAIYTNGAAGKFDSASSFPQNLAEAQISVNGQTPATILGSNTNWQTKTITFTATQSGTPVQITGIEPGILLDDFVLTQVPGNLYYLPEQSLDAFTGENAFGNWTLEIQDDRAGDGLTNLLTSWQLQFVFADTNAIPASVGGGVGQTNFVGAGDIAWYLINVPSTANYATNRLKFASAPVNVWFSTNNPPATDILFLPNGTYPSGTNGSVLLSTTNAANLQSSPHIYGGQTYYLGVQNTNSFTVNYGVEVDFDGTNNVVTPSLVIGSVSVSGGATTLNWTASPSAQFQVQWTDDLTQSWNTDPQIITSSDGNFTFTDDGSQTAPLGPQRFYRLVQISP